MLVFCLHLAKGTKYVWYPRSPDEGIGSPGTGARMVVSEGDVGASNQAQLLCKSGALECGTFSPAPPPPQYHLFPFLSLKCLI